MIDVAAFLAACLTSPALLTSACALIVVPTLAWLAVRALVPAVRGMRADAGWQAGLAAAGAALPGTLFVVIGMVTARDAWDSACLQFAAGRVVYGGIVVLTACGVARATVRATRRHADVQRLVRRSSAPCARLSNAARACGVRAREIDGAGAPVLLLAGIFRPVVLVSAVALERMDEGELHAALRHEAAHAVRRDLPLAAGLAFLADLVPLPVGPLLDMFRAAREFAADRQATLAAEPVDLAAALIALARSDRAPSAAAAFAESATVGARVRVLLSNNALAPDLRRRYAVAAALATIFVVGSAPTAVAVMFGFSCALAMVR